MIHKIWHSRPQHSLRDQSREKWQRKQEEKDCVKPLGTNYEISDYKGENKYLFVGVVVMLIAILIIGILL